MSLFRKFLAPLASVGTGSVILIAGGPADWAGIAAGSVDQLVGGMLLPTRSREEVISDEPNRENRAEAYESLGTTVATAWQAAGILMTFRPKFVGYVHGLLLLMRAQKRFEEQIAASAGALSSVLLYASSDTVDAAVDLYRTFSERLTEVGHSGRQGSPEAQSAYDVASLEIGNKAVVWRRAAQADLGLPLSE